MIRWIIFHLFGGTRAHAQSNDVSKTLTRAELARRRALGVRVEVMAQREQK